MRWAYAILSLITIALGLGSRASFLPAWVHLYVGDVLWAVMFYLLFRVVFWRAALWRALVLTLLVTWGIEASQCLTWPWLVAIRSHRIGGLLLGHGFLWSDVLACGVGAALIWCVDRVMLKLWHACPS